eukprot:2442020-Rhodomonas_salina.1
MSVDAIVGLIECVFQIMVDVIVGLIVGCKGRTPTPRDHRTIVDLDSCGSERRLQGSHFRMLNEELYTTQSKEAQ